MNWSKPENQKLLQAIMSLESESEARAFLRDLLTEKELVEFGKRLKAAEMLAAGQTYQEVEKATKFSSTTVARVARWLNKGEGGYKKILAKLHHHSGHTEKA